MLEDILSVLEQPILLVGGCHLQHYSNELNPWHFSVSVFLQSLCYYVLLNGNCLGNPSSVITAACGKGNIGEIMLKRRKKGQFRSIFWPKEIVVCVCVWISLSPINFSWSPLCWPWRTLASSCFLLQLISFLSHLSDHCQVGIFSLSLLQTITLAPVQNLLLWDENVFVTFWLVLPPLLLSLSLIQWRLLLLGLSHLPYVCYLFCHFNTLENKNSDIPNCSSLDPLFPVIILSIWFSIYS